MMFVVLVFSFLALQVSYGLPSSRIVNGEDADYGKHPWQASLQWNNGGGFSHICGAVLLSEYWIVTAAHCVEHDINNPSNFIIALGKHTFSSNVETNLQRITPRTIRMHEDYNSDNIANDIAVIQLSEPARVGEHNVNFVHLPPYANKIKEYEGAYCYITGWGRLSGGSGLPDTLQEVETDVITNSACRNRLGLTGYLYLKDFNVCVYTGNSGACNGDSGGPLVCEVPGSEHNVHGHEFQLVGVTSWGLRDCPVNSPSVYTRITSFLDWLNENMK